jgi:hypothetical protein
MLDLVKREIAEERLAICKQCDRLTLGVCKECGCFMLAKTTLRWASCPLGKWGVVPPTEPENENKENQ